MAQWIIITYECMHQQTKHQIFITVSIIVAKSLLLELCGNSDMLGPFFFDRNTDGQNYLHLLNDEVIPLTTMLFQNQFHENRFQRLWWAQDGAPCHWLLAVRGRLNKLSRGRILSLHNNTEWPRRSLDLTPWFFIWVY